MTKHAAWTPCERNTLKGFTDIRVRELHLIIYGVAMHERDGRRCAQLPAKPVIKGELLRDDSRPPGTCPAWNSKIERRPTPSLKHAGRPWKSTANVKKPAVATPRAFVCEAINKGV